MLTEDEIALVQKHAETGDHTPLLALADHLEERESPLHLVIRRAIQAHRIPAAKKAGWGITSAGNISGLRRDPYLMTTPLKSGARSMLEVRTPTHVVYMDAPLTHDENRQLQSVRPDKHYEWSGVYTRRPRGFPKSPHAQLARTIKDPFSADAMTPPAPDTTEPHPLEGFLRGVFPELQRQQHGWTARVGKAGDRIVALVHRPDENRLHVNFFNADTGDAASRKDYRAGSVDMVRSLVGLAKGAKERGLKISYGHPSDQRRQAIYTKALTAAGFAPEAFRGGMGMATHVWTPTGKGNWESYTSDLHKFNQKYRTPVKLARIEPVPEARRLLNEYVERHREKFGIPAAGSLPDKLVLDPAQSRKVADWFDRMKDRPDHPRVKAAYGALKQELLAQHQFLKTNGIKLVPWTQHGQPYPSSAHMAADARDNRRVYYFPTNAGFGSGEAHAKHPLMEQVPGEAPGVVYNDLLRGVHDYFAHAAGGNQFGPTGELNAWAEHAKTFSPLARAALTTETHGQNSWVNFGPHSHRPVTERPFADQKAGLLPASAQPVKLADEWEDAHAWETRAGRRILTDQANRASREEVGITKAQQNKVAKTHAAQERELADRKYLRERRPLTRTPDADITRLSKAALAKTARAFRGTMPVAGMNDDARSHLNLAPSTLATVRQMIRNHPEYLDDVQKLFEEHARLADIHQHMLKRSVKPGTAFDNAHTAALEAHAHLIDALADRLPHHPTQMARPTGGVDQIQAALSAGVPREKIHRVINRAANNRTGAAGGWYKHADGRISLVTAGPNGYHHSLHDSPDAARNYLRAQNLGRKNTAAAEQRIPVGTGAVPKSSLPVAQKLPRRAYPLPRPVATPVAKKTWTQWAVDAIDNSRYGRAINRLDKFVSRLARTPGSGVATAVQGVLSDRQRVRRLLAAKLAAEARLKLTGLTDALVLGDGAKTRDSLVQKYDHTDDHNAVTLLAAWYGLMSGEPRTLAFHAHDGGQDSLHVWTTDMKPADLHAYANRLNVPHLVVGLDGTAYSFDRGSAAADNIDRLKRETTNNAADHPVERGTAHLIGAGAGSGADARAAYSDIIRRATAAA